MTRFDIIWALRTYATSKGWSFIAGDNFYQNYEANEASFYNGKLVLSADFTATVLYRNNGLTEISYSGVLMLGRKFDLDGTPNIADDPLTVPNEYQVFNDSTPSNLDETFQQKYDRRLLFLMTELESSIRGFACANELICNSANMTLAMNRFDTNIDFVVANLTFVQ